MEKSKLGQTGQSKDLSQSRMNATASLGKTQPTGGAATGSKGMASTMGGGSKSQQQPSLKKQEQSSEQEIMEKEIQSVEVARLAKVFDQLRTASLTSNRSNTHQSSKDNFNNSNNNISSNQIKESTTGNNKKDQQQQQQQQQSGDSKDYFTAKDVAIILEDLGYPISKAEIDQMIWEVDENLDDHVNSYEFNLMYRRCRHDTTGLEPRNLYNLVQFLMYLKSDANVSSSSSNQAMMQTPEQANAKKTITVEDTLELLYVRYGRLNLDREIEEIFGKDEKNAQGEEKSITLKEYLDKQRKRDFAQRKELEAERKKVKMPDEEKNNRY